MIFSYYYKWPNGMDFEYYMDQWGEEAESRNKIIYVSNVWWGKVRRLN